MKRTRYKMHNQWLCAPRIGELNPIFMQEVTPGDTWSGRSTGVFRLSPLDVPAYMSLNVFVHYFFVPHRIVWPEFEEVITGADTTTPWPTITYQALDAGNWLKWGINASTTVNPVNNALPIRAFNKIYNEHFRNHLITNERTDDQLDVARINFPSSDYYGGITSEIQQGTEETVDSSGATIGITEIRDAFHRQRLKERRSQFGERYRDYLLSDFNVRAPDSRLDRPEHCARSKTTIGISEVVATATSATENTGEFRGHGIAGIQTKFNKKYFSEHGTLMGVMYARPRLQLHKRRDKIWYIQDKDDLYNPMLSNDTQVVVRSGEVHSNVAESNYGYTSRDEWLRTGRDTIAGAMLGSAQEPWHAHIDVSTLLPPLANMQQVQDYDYLFQDQTATRADLHSYFDHRIGKVSNIKRRSK